MPSSSPPLFLFAHGAGAGSAHAWMRHWTALLQTIGPVHTFDYHYITAGGRPPRLPELIAEHRAALAAARQGHSGPVILIGKSMGGRVGCHVASQEPVSAVICLGYPLCGGGDCGKLRDQVLVDLARPILLVQGTRDRLCPLDILAGVQRRMRCRHELFVVTGGDHSLSITKTQAKASGETQDDVDRSILQAIRRFADESAATEDHL